MNVILAALPDLPEGVIIIDSDIEDSEEESAEEKEDWEADFIPTTPKEIKSLRVNSLLPKKKYQLVI